MYKFPGKICNTNLSYTTCQFGAAQYGYYISAQSYVIRFKNFIIQAASIKILFCPLVMKESLTPTAIQMLDSNLKINYDIHFDTKYHVPYKTCSV